MRWCSPTSTYPKFFGIFLSRSRWIIRHRPSGRLYWRKGKNGDHRATIRPCSTDQDDAARWKRPLRLSIRTDPEAIPCSSTDDFAITASSIDRMTAFKDSLTRHFEMSDLGELAWILGIRVKRDRVLKTTSLSHRGPYRQREYTLRYV
jgi:hypothetical protein